MRHHKIEEIKIFLFYTVFRSKSEQYIRKTDPLRILLVEDNKRLNGLISEALLENGFAVDSVSDARMAENAVKQQNYATIILDLGLPDRDGTEILQEWRHNGVGFPILILTARDAKSAVIDGLNRGADDYLCKPFDMGELIARVRVLMRRPDQSFESRLWCKNVCFDVVQRRVYINDEEIALTPRELNVFEHFMRRIGQVVQRRELEKAVYRQNEDPDSNALEVLIHRLRRKMDQGGATVKIHTLRGLGYLLSETV